MHVKQSLNISITCTTAVDTKMDLYLTIFFLQKMYVGLPLEYMEAIRLLGKDSEEFSVEDYLKQQWSPFTFKWIDKNLWILGIKIYNDEYTHVHRMLEQIRSAEQVFYIEAKRLNMDLSRVELAIYDRGPIEVLNAKPYLLEYH